MSYKVSAIIIPFCRNLLDPAMVAAFFVTSDDGLAEKLQEACKNRHGHKALAPCSHRQPDQGRTFRDFFDERKWINGATNDQRLLFKNTSYCSIAFVKGKEPLAHFVDNSLTYDSFWTRFEVAERLRDFAFCATPSTRDSVQSSRDRLRHVFCVPDAYSV